MAQVRSKVLELCQNKNAPQAFEMLIKWDLSVLDHPGHWEFLARACLRNGEKDIFARTCDALLRAEHLHGDLAIAYAATLAARGEASVAADLVTRLFGENPSQPEARSILVKALIETDPDRALGVLGKSKKRDLETELLRVDTLRQLDRLAEAAALLEQLAKKFPDESRVATRKARLEERLGHWAEAIHQWSAILGNFPAQATTARMKLIQLQSRFERIDHAADTAAEFIWPQGPQSREIDLMAQIDLLASLSQSRAVNELIIAEAGRVNSAQLGAELWDRVANYLIDSGQIGLAVWLFDQGLPFGAKTANLIATARNMIELSRHDLRDAVKATAINSPQFMLGQISASDLCKPAERQKDGKILLVNATLAAGGAERQFVLLLQSLLAAGVPANRLQVALFSMENNRGHSHFLPSLARLGVEILNLAEREFDLSSLPEEMRQWIALLPRRLRSDILPLIGLCQREKPDVIHGWQDRSAVAAGLAGVICGVPRIVLTARNMQPDRRLLSERGSYRDVYAMLTRRPNVRMSVNSDAGARDYESWIGLPKGTLGVMHNAVDTAAFPVLSQGGIDTTKAKPVVRITGVFRLAANNDPSFGCARFPS